MSGLSSSVCTFCDHPLPPTAEICPRCGTRPLPSAGDIRAVAAGIRDTSRHRQALSDVYFLVGLLLGGPLITIGGELRLGLFVVLAGGLASALHRYSHLSPMGAGTMGSLVAAVIAAVIVDPPPPATAAAADTALAGKTVTATATAREAFAAELAEQLVGQGIGVEARGEEASSLWLHRSRVVLELCGSYPDRAVREHLAQLGFSRVVVTIHNDQGIICSFAP